MRMIVGCEFSGIVRNAFREWGWDAWSCDLLPTEQPGQHFQSDIFDVLNTVPGWDLMIFHWPCTRLCNSGVRWLYGGRGTRVDPNRWKQMEDDAKNFVRLLYWPGIGRVAGENPVPHGAARRLMGDYSQTIQPYEHGHGETKRTCLWLRGLPTLKPSHLVNGRTPRVHHESPGPERWKNRSRTYPGIAMAMASQWTDFFTTSGKMG